MATNPKADQAQAVHQRYSERIAAIRKDDRLSDKAIRIALAQAWVTAADALAKLREAYQDDFDRERRQLEARVLRPTLSGLAPTTSDRIAQDASFRDALDRATKAENSTDLIQLLERSERVGDAIQVRAVVATAFERRDLHTLDAHLERHPTERADLERLLDLSGPSAAREKIAVSMVFGPPPIPAETGAAFELGVRQLAEDRAEPAASSPSWF